MLQDGAQGAFGRIVGVTRNRGVMVQSRAEPCLIVATRSTVEFRPEFL